MTDQDPRPLKSSGETPPELARALRALGRDRDAARLARVAERLGTNLSTPAATRWVDKLGGAKLGLAGLALGVGVGVFGYVLLAARTAPPAQPPAAPSVEAPAPAIEPLPVEPANEPEPPAPPTAAAPKFKLPRPARPARTRSEAPAATASAPASAAPAEAPAASTASARAPAPEPASAEAAPARPEPKPEPKAEQAAVAAPKRASELGLLQQARRAAADEPDEALRLLQEHADRFPAGMLTPEREVLSIEVLRKLGRTAEAAERLQKFEARYPRSIYLRRLQRTPGRDL